MNSAEHQGGIGGAAAQRIWVLGGGRQFWVKTLLILRSLPETPNRVAIADLTGNGVEQVEAKGTLTPVGFKDGASTGEGDSDAPGAGRRVPSGRCWSAGRLGGPADACAQRPAVGRRASCCSLAVALCDVPLWKGSWSTRVCGTCGRNLSGCASGARCPAREASSL